MSNFSRPTDAPPSEFRRVRPDEVRDALTLILGGPGVPGDPVAEFTRYATERRIEMTEMWICAVAGRPVWALLPIVSPGRTMLLLAPPRVPADRNVVPLLDAVSDHFRGRGVDLAQVLIEPTDRAARELFATARFREIAELLYLQSPTRRGTEEPPVSGGFAWRTYSDRTHELFARTILASYRESLDCPALNGLRRIDDILAGHRAAGEFDPRFWFALTENDEPRGVLLLTRVPRADLAEVVYLGLVPESRGRGVGDLLLRRAFHAVREMNLPRFTLAVDSRNAPALKLYYRHGLHHIGSRTALLRDLRSR